MNRRKSIKAIALGSIAAGMLGEACKPEDKKITEKTSEPAALNYDRMQEEVLHHKKILDQGSFFTPEEMTTITTLTDIIVPKDEVSGSASEAGVPAFIEFIVKDMPYHQTPLRGGLRWLDLQCLQRFSQPFRSCTTVHQIEMVDLIAYPNRVKKKPELAQGVSFFNRMRDLTLTGFYTTQMGFKDLGYLGNTPNQWNGVPDDVLKEYGLAYSEKELKESISFNNHQ